MTSFEDLEDIINNRHQRGNIPNRAKETVPSTRLLQRDPINLGSDPGALLAALPALLGFVPAQSLVVVGLLPAGNDSASCMTVGPVIRVDFHRLAIQEGLETFLEAMTSSETIPLNQCEVVLIGIGDPGEKRSRALSQARGVLEEHNLRINGHFLIHRLTTGARWQEVNTNREGAVGDVDDNPLQNIATLSGAVRLQDRAEMERWLDEAGEPLEVCPPLSEPGDSVQRLADVEDVIEVFRAVLEIVQGRRGLERVCADRSLLTRVAHLALSEVLHPTLIVAGAGAHAAVVRDILNAAARTCRGAARWRLMAILAIVLGGNDEGTLAFSTLNRTMNELETEGEENSLTAALTLTAISAHHRGKTRELFQLALDRGIHVLAACHHDVQLATDLGARVDDLLEDFDASLDILDIDYLRQMNALSNQTFGRPHEEPRHSA